MITLVIIYVLTSLACLGIIIDVLDKMVEYEIPKIEVIIVIIMASCGLLLSITNIFLFITTGELL